MGALNRLQYKELPIKQGEPSMSNYVIITDTSADIPADILDKGQIHLIPMVYQLKRIFPSVLEKKKWEIS